MIQGTIKHVLSDEDAEFARVTGKRWDDYDKSVGAKAKKYTERSVKENNIQSVGAEFAFRRIFGLPISLNYTEHKHHDAFLLGRSIDVKWKDAEGKWLMVTDIPRIHKHTSDFYVSVFGYLPVYWFIGVFPGEYLLVSSRWHEGKTPDADPYFYAKNEELARMHMPINDGNIEDMFRRSLQIAKRRKEELWADIKIQL